MVKPISEKKIPKRLRTSTYVGRKNADRVADVADYAGNPKRKKKTIRDIEKFLGIKLL